MPPTEAGCQGLRWAQTVKLQARKDNDARNVERRAVNARYLAELIKFRCMPFGAFFVLLKVRLRIWVISRMVA